ncbi:MAG: chorismate mutase [Firmicutes bacterium]|nr:chorismate mutase [Bacillota bacterium]
MLRGIRGATTVRENRSEEILEATKELLTQLVNENGITASEIAAIIFSVTSDLNAAFPAAAGRELGWDTVPFLCTTEIPVPGSLPRCIRILVLLNTGKEQDRIKHVYLRDAVSLRPDLVGT